MPETQEWMEQRWMEIDSNCGGRAAGIGGVQRLFVHAGSGDGRTEHDLSAAGQRPTG